MAVDGGAVLVLTARFDPTADLVVEELTARNVAVFRCDSGDFPTRLQLSAELSGEWSGKLSSPARSLDLGLVRSAYYRRPSAFRMPLDIAPHDESWATTQARLGFGGVLAAVPRWLNHPARIGSAGYKPVQLSEAIKAGLAVPRTLFTNDPAAARDFAADVGAVVYKPLAGNAGDDHGQPLVIYTTDVSGSDLSDPSIASTVHLFQQRIVKEYEVRLTVIDAQFFAARITTRSPDAPLDWRADVQSLEYTLIETPSHIRTSVSDLMRRLGLRFGALDFAVTPEGEWVFFEINPNGQWGWIQQATGAPLAATIAQALMPEPEH